MSNTSNGTPVTPPVTDLVVGENTYVDVEDSNTYISTNYLTTETKYINWNALSDDAKAISLRRAMLSLEAIPVPGMKYDPGQDLNFPREPAPFIPARRGGYLYYYGASGEVPQAVIDAEVEEALEIASPSTDSKAFNAANSGLKSFRYSKVAETFKDNSASKNAGTAKYLKSVQAQILMSRYVAGSFTVR